MVIQTIEYVPNPTSVYRYIYAGSSRDEKRARRRKQREFIIFSALASPGVELLGGGGGSYGFLCFSLILQLLHGES